MRPKMVLKPTPCAHPNKKIDHVRIWSLTSRIDREEPGYFESDTSRYEPRMYLNILVLVDVKKSAADIHAMFRVS
jgi:hypothetical protein